MIHRRKKHTENRNSFRCLSAVLVFFLLISLVPASGLTADAAAPLDDPIVLDESGTATVRLRHGQKMTLAIPLGYRLEIQEILPQGSRYTPSVQTDIGGVETNTSGTPTTGSQEIDDNAVIAYVNTFEAIVPTGITPGADPIWVLLLSAVLLASAAIVPAVICRHRRGPGVLLSPG